MTSFCHTEYYDSGNVKHKIYIYIAKHKALESVNAYNSINSNEVELVDVDDKCILDYLNKWDIKLSNNRIYVYEIYNDLPGDIVKEKLFFQNFKLIHKIVYDTYGTLIAKITYIHNSNITVINDIYVDTTNGGKSTVVIKYLNTEKNTYRFDTYSDDMEEFSKYRFMLIMSLPSEDDSNDNNN